MHLLDAPAILALCEEDQCGTCIHRLGLSCSQADVHLSTSMGEELVSCKIFFFCSEMRAEIISSDHKRDKRQNCGIFHI